MFVVDIFIILGSVATMTIAVCAVIGLFTWRKQHSAKIESDLAIRLLVSIRKYRDIMGDFADPLTSIASIIHLLLPREDDLSHAEKQRMFEEREKIQYKRLNKVVSARQEFYDDVLISETLWGEEVQSIIEEMREIEATFREKTAHELAAANPDAEPEEKDDTKKILEAMPSDEELLVEFDKLVKKAAKYLRPKILTAPHKPTNTKKGTK